MNRRHDHTTAVCVSLPWSGSLHVVRLPAGSWHGLPRLAFVWDAKCLAVATHFHGLYSSLELCCEGPWFTSVQEDGCEKGAHQSYPGTGRTLSSNLSSLPLCFANLCKFETGIVYFLNGKSGNFKNVVIHKFMNKHVLISYQPCQFMLAHWKIHWMTKMVKICPILLSATQIVIFTVVHCVFMLFYIV